MEKKNILDRDDVKNNGSINMNSLKIEGDIDMETIHPQKGNVMVECNHEREDIGSSKRFKGSEEINKKN